MSQKISFMPATAGASAVVIVVAIIIITACGLSIASNKAIEQLQSCPKKKSTSTPSGCPLSTASMVFTSLVMILGILMLIAGIMGAIAAARLANGYAPVSLGNGFS